MNKGFTLVELLGVILIIALLSIVMFPNVINNFFATSERLDQEVNSLIVEAAKDYYANKRDQISHLDYCTTILTLQEEGLLAYDIKNSEGKIIDSDRIVKIGKNGASYTVDGVCNMSQNDIIEAARKYYLDGNISIATGASRCITILDLQNKYYLSKNITNGINYYNANISIKITNTDPLTIAYAESC